MTYPAIIWTAIIISGLVSGKALAASLPERTCGRPVVQPPANRSRVLITVADGREVKRHSWPWQIEILYNDVHHCVGSLIAQNWIVTAAHCIFNGVNLEKMKVRAGRHSKLPYRREKNEQLASVTRVYVHHGFKTKTNRNDIALIRLCKKLKWTDQVSPVCLTKAGKKDPAAGTRMVVTSLGFPKGICCTDVRKQAVVRIVNRTTCNSEDLHNGTITANMICAGYSKGVANACVGDSGGPLVQKTQSRWELVGIVSWGRPECGAADKPGVYTKVANYLTWIHDVIDADVQSP